jgi:hypothetical protein
VIARGLGITLKENLSIGSQGLDRKIKGDKI